MKIRILFLFSFLFCAVQAQKPEQRAEVTLQTTHGKIVLALYNQTPLHRDNFLQKVSEGYYDGILFHRIIEKFMIQSGDSASRAVPASMYFPSEKDDTTRIPAEFRFPELFHRRGVLAAAREGDEVNPERASSNSQFYIVWGKYFGPKEMREMQEKVNERENPDCRVTFPKNVIDAYEIDGGTPHLDGIYTVFGEVIKGLDVVGTIQAVKTDSLDRPIKDVRIKKAFISKPLLK